MPSQYAQVNIVDSTGVVVDSFGGGGGTFVSPQSLFYDEFNGTTLDAAKWEQIWGDGTVAIANGVATLTDAVSLKNKVSFTAPMCIKYNIAYTTGQYQHDFYIGKTFANSGHPNTEDSGYFELYFDGYGLTIYNWNTTIDTPDFVNNPLAQLAVELYFNVNGGRLIVYSTTQDTALIDIPFTHGLIPGQDYYCAFVTQTGTTMEVHNISVTDYQPAVDSNYSLLKKFGTLATDSTQYLDFLTTQVITTSGTSAASSAVSATTKRVQVQATKAAWIAIGSDPTAAVATAGSFYLPDGGQSAPFLVTSSTTKVAAIQDSAAGKVVVIESK